MLRHENQDTPNGFRKLEAKRHIITMVTTETLHAKCCTRPKNIQLLIMFQSVKISLSHITLHIRSLWVQQPWNQFPHRQPAAKFGTCRQ